MEVMEIIEGTGDIHGKHLLGQVEKYSEMVKNMAGRCYVNKDVAFERLYLRDAETAINIDSIIDLKNEILSQYLALPVPLIFKFEDIGFNDVLCFSDSELKFVLTQLVDTDTDEHKGRLDVFFSAIDSITEEFRFIMKIGKEDNRYNAIDGYIKLLAHKYNVSVW